MRSRGRRKSTECRYVEDTSQRSTHPAPNSGHAEYYVLFHLAKAQSVSLKELKMLHQEEKMYAM